MLDAKTLKRIKRRLGPKYARQTKFDISFELSTPRDYFDPAVDEVLLLDLLDHISNYVMEFHDVPGFKLLQVKINNEEVV